MSLIHQLLFDLNIADHRVHLLLLDLDHLLLPGLNILLTLVHTVLYHLLAWPTITRLVFNMILQVRSGLKLLMAFSTKSNEMLCSFRLVSDSTNLLHVSGKLFVTVCVEFVTFTARISSQLRPDDQVALNNLLSQFLLLDPEPEEMNQRLVNAGEAGC